MARARLLLLVLLAACQGRIGSEQTETDAGQDVDASEPGTLTLEFHRKPKFGGEYGGNPEQEIRDVELRLKDIRLVGDAAENVRVAAIELLWTMDVPDKLRTRVDDAPHGLYSRVDLIVESYVLEGTCVVGQDPAMGFEIADSRDLAVSVNLRDFRAEPDGENLIHIDIELKEAVDWDWSLVDPVDDVRVMTDPGMLDEVAEELSEGFKLP